MLSSTKSQLTYRSVISFFSHCGLLFLFFLYVTARSLQLLLYMRRRVFQSFFIVLNIFYILHKINKHFYMFFVQYAIKLSTVFTIKYQKSNICSEKSAKGRQADPRPCPLYYFKNPLRKRPKRRASRASRKRRPPRV